MKNNWFTILCKAALGLRQRGCKGFVAFITRKFRRKTAFIVIQAAWMTLSSNLVIALPQGAQVAAGKAQVATPTADTMVITTSDKVIINYQDFSIGAKQKVQFIQPSSSSCALNRVTGGNPSSIFGQLQANGKIFLVNPNGILFGPSSIVNTGSLVASTLNIRNEDFLSGNYQFYAEKGAQNSLIHNQGTLSASPEGQIVMMSPHIRNEGTIAAKAGKVVLASGERVTLDFSGDGLISFSVDGELPEGSIDQAGVITAPGSNVYLSVSSADRVIRNIVNTDHVVEGNAIVNKGGVIRICNRSRLEAQNVALQGNQVEMTGEIVAQGDLKVQAKDTVRLRDSKEDALVCQAYGAMTIEADHIDILALQHPQTSIASGRDMTLVSDNPISGDAHFSSGGFTLLKTTGQPGDFFSLYDPIISATGNVTFGAYSGASLKVESTGSITSTGSIAVTTSDPTAPLTDTDGATLQASPALILRAGVTLQNQGLPVPPTQTTGGAMFSSGGAGTGINLNGGSITTNNGPVILQGNVTLGVDTSITTGGGDITVMNNIDGLQNLSLTAGTGNINITGAVGSSTPLNALSIVSANNATFSSAVSAASVSQAAGTGLTTFSGAVTTSGAAGVSLTGSNFTFNSPVTTGSTGPVTINQSGTLSIGSGANINPAGAFQQTGAGAVSLDANITTTNGQISFTGPVTLSQSVVLDSSAGTGDITFGSTVDGTTADNQNLTLTAGANNITLTGAAGFGTRLGTFTVTSANNFTASSNLDAKSIVFSSLTGTGTFNGPVNTNTSAGMSFTGNNFTFNSTVNVTNNGGFTCNNSGLLTFSTSSPVVVVGVFNQSGTGGVSLGNNITTTNNNITFNGPVTLTGPSTVNAGAGTANVTFNSTINGTQNLSLSATGGNIVLGGAVGGVTALGNLSFLTAVNVTTGAITAAQISQIAGTGLTTFNGALIANTSGISLTGKNVTFNSTVTSTGDVDLADTGIVTMSAANAMTITGNFNQSVATATVSTAGNISTTGNISFTAPITLTGPVTWNSSPGNGNISISSTINGTTAGAQNLTMNAGSGNITTTLGLGATKALGDFSILGATNITASAGITANSIAISNVLGLGTFQSLTSLAAAGVSLSGSAFTLNAGIITSNNGPVSINNTGTLNFNGGGIFAAGPVTETGGGQVTGTVFVQTSNQTINFASDIVLTGASSFTSQGGNITFGGTVDGHQNLSVAGGTTGNVLFNMDIGGVTPLANFSVSGNNITTQFITADTITQTAGAGTTTFNDDILSQQVGGINLTGTNFAFNGAVTTLLGGPFIVKNSGTLNLPSSSSLSLSGTFQQTGTGAVNLGASITTNNALISFAGPVTLTSDVNLNTGSGVGDITFSNTLNGTHNLVLFAGTGNITLTGAVGGGGLPLNNLTFNGQANVTANAITAASISQTAGTGTTTFSGPLSTTAAGGISLIGNTFAINSSVTTTGGGGVTVTNAGTLSIGASSSMNIAGSFVQNGAGAVNLAGSISTTANPISFASPVTLTGATTLNSTGGNITFSNTVNGTNQLSLAAGTGNILFSGILGGTTRIGHLIINSANNVTAPAITATTIALTGVTGTTTFNGALNTSLSGGISLAGNIFNINGTVTTTGSGPVSINNSGLLTLASGANMNLSGAFLQIGAGNVTMADNITTANSNISFASPVTLSGPVALNTGTGIGDITFSSTVSGTQNLTLTAGTGNIFLNGAVGSPNPLNVLTIASAKNVTATTISATSIVQTAGSGTTTFNGPVTTTGAAGINLTGTNFAINNTITTTTGSGPLTIKNSGTLNLTPPAVLNLGSFFAQTGTGPVNLGINISTPNSNITFDGPVSLMNPVVLNSSGGNIAFNNTLNGSQNLTLTPGTGTISLPGNVGNVTRLGAFVVTSATSLTLNNITAASISANVTGLTTITGTLNTNTAAGITLTGNTFTINGGFTTTNTGPVSLTNSGLMTFGNSSTSSIDGTFTQTGAGAVQLAGNITTNNNTISFASPITLTGAATLNTGAGAGDISFASTIDGANSLTLAAGTGNINFGGNIGSTTRIGALTISSVNNVTVPTLTAASLTQSNGTGTTTFNGPVNTNGAAGINLKGNNFSFNNTVTTTGGGPVVINNSGTLTLPAAAVFNLASSFNQSGIGPVQLGTSITTNNANISFNGAVTLTTPVSLNTGAGAGDITLSGSVGGAQNLNLTAGTGNIVLSGTIGAPRIGALTIVSAANVTANAITAASITQNAGTGTTTFNGTLDTNTATGINLTGHNFAFNGAVNTTAGGPVVVTNSGTLTLGSGTVMTLAGPFTQNGAGAVTAAGSISTATSSQNISFLSPVTLGGNFTLNSGAGTGNITFSNTINGGHNLSMAAGGGNITLNGNAGATTRLGAFTITSANNVTTKAITAASINISGVTGTTTFNGALNTSGGAGIVLSGNVINFNGAVTTTGGGGVTITNSGLLTIPSGSNFSLTGPFMQSGAGTVNLGANITTTNNNISFGSAVNLTNNVALNTGTGPGDITFNSTVNGAFNLSLAAGTGNVNFVGAVGGVTRLGTLTISSAHNVTANAITAGAIVQSADTGTTTFNGALNTNTAAGISLTGTNFVFNSSVTTTNTGPLTVNNSGTLTIGAGASFNLSGPFTQNGTGTTLLGQNIITPSKNVLFTGPVILTNNVVIDTSPGVGNITFLSTINGADNLTLTAPNSTITLGGAVGGSTRLANFSITSATTVTTKAITAQTINVSGVTGTATFNGQLNTNAAGGIVLSGSAFNINGGAITTSGGPFSVTNSGLLSFGAGNVMSINGAFTQSGAGNVDLAGSITTNNQNISFASPVTLTGNTTLNSGAGAGDISFASTVNGAHNLSVSAGTGNVAFNQIVGGTTRLGALSIGSAANVTFTAAVSAASIAQTSGTGTTTFDGPINTNGAAGINLAGTNFNINDTVTTTNGGNVVINNTGTLTLPSSAVMSLSGAFNQTGTGPVSLNVNIATSNQNIGFTGPVSLIGPVSLNTGAGAGNITFSGTVNGAQNLDLTAGTGNIVFSQPVGGGTRLGTLTIHSATNVTANAITAAAITQLAGSGTTTFNGALDTNAGGGINLTGKNFAINNTVHTTSGGPLIINNSGTFTMSPAAVLTLSGPFNQNGAGAASVQGSITTTAQPITFAAPVTLTGNLALNTGAGGNITFNNTLNGPGGLAMAAGTGNINLAGAAGQTTALGPVSVTSATNAAFPAITAQSIAVAGVTGTTNFLGAVKTTGAAGINVNAAVINFNSPVTTTNGGPMSIVNSGLLTIAPGANLTLAGPFTQTGAGNVSLGSTITSTNNNISFASPINLTGSVTLNASNTGNITLSSTVDGSQNFTVKTGTGTITLSGALGGGIRLKTFTIAGANNVSAQAITADAILQQAGTGTTTFNGPLNTDTAAGINLTGTNFTFLNPVTTTGGGSLTINNAGTLTLPSTAPLNLAGAFAQTGAGPVLLGESITTNNQNISFAGKVSLSGPTTLNTGAGAGDITLSGSVNGAQPLILTAGTGSVFLNGAIGNTTPLTSLSASGAAITQNGAVTTNGPVTYTAGTISAGGNITTNGNAIQLNGNVVAIAKNNVTLASGGGNIVMTGSLNGGGSTGGALTLNSGAGNISFSGPIGITKALAQLTLISNDITVPSVGTASAKGVTGTLTMTAANNINFQGNDYNANSEIYTAGSFFNVNAPGTTSFIDGKGPLTFNTGKMQLNGNVAHFSSTGGSIKLPAIDPGGVIVDSPGPFFVVAPITATFVQITAHGNISNVGGPHAITTTGDTSLNAIGGNVGSVADPIQVLAGGSIFVGGKTLAAIIGSSIDNTVHSIPSNPPCFIYFNHILIHQCRPPVPPKPPVPPIPPLSHSELGIFAYIEHLGADEYFYPDYIDDCYVLPKREVLFWLPPLGLAYCEEESETPWY